MITDQDLHRLTQEVIVSAARRLVMQGHLLGERDGEKAGYAQGWHAAIIAVNEKLAAITETGEPELRHSAISLRDALSPLLQGDPYTPLEDLNLSVRAYNALKRAGKHTIADLILLTSQQLLSSEYPNFGTTCLKELDQALKNFGHHRVDVAELSRRPFMVFVLPRPASGWGSTPT